MRLRTSNVALERLVRRLEVSLALALLSPGVGLSQSTSAPVPASAAVSLPALTVPSSVYASPGAHDYFAAHVLPEHPAFGADILAARAYYDNWNRKQLERALQIYAVNVRADQMDGVKVDIVTPKAGVRARQRHRVLINLHGGAFAWGAHFGGLLESVPVAALGGYEVVTVDYREGPENRFPAASEDVAKIYAALLKEHKSAKIGIYGCSAGGVLTAESIAWFEAHGLPRPGAIALLCSGAGEFDGDSSYLAPPLNGSPPIHTPQERLSAHQLPYFAGADLTSPLVLPFISDAVLRKFPPTLVISATRDPALSVAAATDVKLNSLGVESELHVWDGLWHAFMVVPDLPESRAAFEMVVRFFDRRLGD